MENKEKKEVECPKCNHKWRTKSKYKFVTCPFCLSKVQTEVKGG